MIECKRARDVYLTKTAKNKKEKSRENKKKTIGKETQAVWTVGDVVYVDIYIYMAVWRCEPTRQPTHVRLYMYGAK